MPPALLSKKAFTLIELLVVIAIIAILAGLLFPAFKNARVTSNRSVTTSNLKQVAAAILGYAGDNDMELPGPLATGQGPDYSTTTTDTLGFRLWKYLGAPEPTASVQQAKLLTNPAYEKARQSRDAPAYVMNQRVVDSAGVEQKPWGVSNGSTANQAPLRTVVVAGWGGDRNDGTRGIDLARVWAMQDVDQKNVATLLGSQPSWFDSLPKTPAHGDARITMFFDWHVESVKVP
ncbi:MAG: type II secretion system GspH family protein [Chthoniobacter sp.]|nr:type II secretion system GspH family protein [Chthoniobacter sp.]